MVENGQAEIRPVDFGSRLHPRLPVEVVDRHELFARVGSTLLIPPERPSFHLLVLIRSHQGSHTVDFTEIPARPRRLIHVRPGQVQVFNTRVDFDATLVLSQPALTSAHPWFPGHSPYCDLDDEAMTTAEDIVAALRRQQARFEGDQPTSQVMTSLFAVLLALNDQAQTDTDNSPLPEVYVAFRNAIEADLTHRHSVIDYARQIGYSSRTITRACQQAAGQTAKRVLTDRLVLEAKRLLVHTDAPAATISAQLGFSEPTNFTKFFTHNTAQTPSAFRDLH
jgi:AraC-like DNA-binding protein